MKTKKQEQAEIRKWLKKHRKEIPEFKERWEQGGKYVELGLKEDIHTGVLGTELSTKNPDKKSDTKSVFYRDIFDPVRAAEQMRDYLNDETPPPESKCTVEQGLISEYMAFLRSVSNLTDLQKETLKLYAVGFTQEEIAKEMRKSQPAVAKTIRVANMKLQTTKERFGGGYEDLRRQAIYWSQGLYEVDGVVYWSPKKLGKYKDT